MANNASFCRSVEDCGPASACTPLGKCVCDQYWSTNMDFLNFETCATNEIAMYILWAINVLIIFFVLYKSAWVIVLRFENFLEQRRVKRNYTLFQNKGLIAIIFEFGLSMPCQFAMAVLHFFQPTTRVGFDLLPTCLFFFSKLGFYACIIFVQGPMLAVTLKGDPNKQRIVRLGYTSNSISSVLGMINGALPFIIYVNYDKVGFEVQQLAVMQAYYFIQTIAMTINLCLSLVIIKKVNEAFDRAEGIVSSAEQKNKNIRGKVNDLQKETIRQATLQGTIYLLMGAIPFFWTRHAYFLPISWLAMPLLGMKLAHQVTLDKKGAKTIMQRLGIKKTSTFGDTDKKDGNSSLMDGTRTVNQGGSMMVPMSSQQGRKIQSSVVSETTQMEELLSPDHPANKKFIEYVKSRHAQSELELLEQLLVYKHAKSLKERKKIGQVIMKKYILDGAPHQVDIPDGIKKILESTAAKGMFVEGTFDAVRGPLVFDIKGNFFAPFEKKMSMNTFSEENF